MFAIVDVSRRASRGKILLLIDDKATAVDIAQELNQGSVDVVVQAISPEQLDQVQADVRSGSAPPRTRAIA